MSTNDMYDIVKRESTKYDMVNFAYVSAMLTYINFIKSDSEKKAHCGNVYHIIKTYEEEEDVAVSSTKGKKLLIVESNKPKLRELLKLLAAYIGLYSVAPTKE